MKELRIGLADQDGTSVEIGCTEEGADALITFRVHTGGASVYAYPTHTAARQVAAALLDAADEYERETA